MELYSYMGYCLDQLVMTHNYSMVEDGNKVDFAYLCIDRSVSVAKVVEVWRMIIDQMEQNTHFFC